VREGIVQQISLSTRLQRPVDAFVAIIGAEHNNLGFGRLFEDHVDWFQSVHLRHAEVQQQYVGAVQEKLLNRLLGVRCFAHNMYIFLERDQRIQPFSDNGMIIRNESADLFDESRLGFLFHWEAVGGHGTVTATRVPFPGWLFSSNFPPISSVRSHVTTFANQVYRSPVFLSLLQIFDRQINQFRASEPTTA
jgi:hypothetical protein